MKRVFRAIQGQAGIGMHTRAAKKGDEKTISALIDVIIARPGTPFTEDDRDFLEQGDVDRLTAIAAWEPPMSAPPAPDLNALLRKRELARRAAKKGR